MTGWRITKKFGLTTKKNNKQRKQEEKATKKWWQDHKELSKDLEQIAFEIAKGSWGLDDKLDAKLLKTILEQENIKSLEEIIIG